MSNKFNISVNDEIDFLLSKLAESVVESKASVVSNLIYQASQNEEEFTKLFRKLKRARLGIELPGHPRTPSQ